MADDKGHKQGATVTTDGARLAPMPEGVTVRPLTTHVDGRGWLMEIWNPVWEWHAEPLVHCYAFTVRPGVTKGWGRHERTEDRYCVMSGEALLVLYDDRPESSTYRMISEIPLSGFHRCLLNIPAGIWHAVANVGTEDFMALNMKTTVFDHADPDKFSLPLDTDHIPYDLAKLRSDRYD
jgi:dTDP-4-dehydrorhamnose 3,5-epimerase